MASLQEIILLVYKADLSLPLFVVQTNKSFGYTFRKLVLQGIPYKADILKESGGMPE